MPSAGPLDHLINFCEVVHNFCEVVHSLTYSPNVTYTMDWALGGGGGPTPGIPIICTPRVTATVLAVKPKVRHTPGM